MSEINKPKNPEDDWKVWLVVNPAVWLMPILFAVLIVALVVHSYVISLGYGFYTQRMRDFRHVHSPTIAKFSVNNERI